MRRHTIRDILARAVTLTPSYGYAWPSRVGGRFRVRLIDERLASGKRLLRAHNLEGFADCLHQDPYSTARALATRYQQGGTVL